MRHEKTTLWRPGGDEAVNEEAQTASRLIELQSYSILPACHMACRRCYIPYCLRERASIIRVIIT